MPSGVSTPKNTRLCNPKEIVKLFMKEKGKGSYVVRVQFVGGEKTDITVDSAAEESVCPEGWGAQFGTYEPYEWLTLTGAGGHEIHHRGQRDVMVEASTF